MDAFDKIWAKVAADAKKADIDGIFSPTSLSLNSVVPFGIPTGVPQLDLALSRPGYPVGRVIEFYGFEASGKSTLALHAVAEIQRMGGSVLWMDTEQVWDANRAAQIGVDVHDPKLKVTCPQSIEDVFKYMTFLLDALEGSGNTVPCLVVVDSITGVSSDENAKKGIEEADRVASDARIIRKGLRKLNPRLAKNKVTTIFVNHSIAKMAAFGKQSQSAGGHAIKFYASVRIELAALGTIKDKSNEDGERLGQRSQLTVEKLKGAPLRFPKFVANLLNDGGFDAENSLLEAMITVGAISRPKGGRYYTFAGTEDTFTADEWLARIEKEGGFGAMYQRFFAAAKNTGYMQPYLLTKSEEVDGQISDPV